MTGRHRGSHRNGTGDRGRKVAVVSALLLLGVVGFAVIRVIGSDSSCGGDVTLSVSVAPELAPAVESASEALTRESATADGSCASITVTAANSAQVGSAIAKSAGATLRGV